MLPLSLLNAAQGKPMLVELKNGETYNGHMIACDNFMNVTLRDVILTSPEGDKFYQMKEVYLKGNVIKYVRVADQILDKVQEDQHRIREQNRHSGGGGRGGGGGDRGGMRGGRGGGGGFRGGPNRGGGAPRGGRGGPGRGGAPGGNRGGRGGFNANGNGP